MHWYLEALKKYATFSGRARRREYWVFNLINSLILVLLVYVFGYAAEQAGIEAIGVVPVAIFMLAIFIPSLSVTVRRLHDTSRSGWYILIQAIPMIGPLIILVFMLFDSTPRDNQYGPNPKATS